MNEEERRGVILPEMRTELAEERALRLAAVAEGVLEQGKEYACRTGMMLSGWEKEAAKYFPEPEMITALPPEDATATLRLVGFLESIVGTRGPWYVQFVDECDKALHDARDKQKMEEVVSRLYTMCALHVGVSINTNTAGASPRHQQGLNDKLAKALLDVGDRGGILALRNPYGIESGEEYYAPTRDREGKLTLTAGRVGEIIVDDENMLIDDEGDTRHMTDFNLDLRSGQKVFRNTKHFIVYPDRPRWLDTVREGELVDIHSRTPGGDTMITCTFLGSNEKELSEKYGDAYRIFLRDLLVFRLLYNGEEIAFPYETRNVEIVPH